MGSGKALTDSVVIEIAANPKNTMAEESKAIKTYRAQPSRMHIATIRAEVHSASPKVNPRMTGYGLRG